jgi:hypothetical protein
MLGMAPKSNTKNNHVVLQSAGPYIRRCTARIHKYVLCRPALSFSWSIPLLHVLKNEEIQDSAALFRAEQSRGEQMFRP